MLEEILKSGMIAVILFLQPMPINDVAPSPAPQTVPVSKLEQVVNQQSQQQRYRILIKKSECKLYLLENKSVVKAYDVGIGNKLHPTPAGKFEISSKIKNPAWISKHETVPYGNSRNPLAAYWFGLKDGNGVGIHGTYEKDSIGRRMSHGCVRMKPRDVIELSNYAKIGAIVEIKE